MRILIVAGYDRSLLNFRLPLIRDMLSVGCDVICCAPLENLDVPQKLGDFGVLFYRLPLKRTGLNPLFDVRTILALRQTIKRVAPDVVLAYTHKPNVCLGLAMRGPHQTKVRAFGLVTGLGYSFELRGSIRQRFAAFALKVAYRLSAPALAGVFFQNVDDAKDFVDWGLVPESGPYHVVPGSGVELGKYTFSSPSVEMAHFSMISRLMPSKGVREYAEAVLRVERSLPTATFSLAGEIDDRDANSIRLHELEKWSADRRLSYHGKLVDVRPLLHSCTVCVLPSYYREGVPRVLLEAMAVGRAIITTDSIGCRETVWLPAGARRDSQNILHGQNGLLVPARDVEALAAAIRFLTERPELVRAMGRRSREIAEERFDVRKVNATMMKAMGLETIQHSPAGAEGTSGL